MGIERRPCNRYHSLPCGLDMACDIPVEYYDPRLSSEKIYKMWKNDSNK